MEHRKIQRICNKLTNLNAAYEGEVHGKYDNEERREIVNGWMWTALMLLSSMGYDIVKVAKKRQVKKTCANEKSVL